MGDVKGRVERLERMMEEKDREIAELRAMVERLSGSSPSPGPKPRVGATGVRKAPPVGPKAGTSSPAAAAKRPISGKKPVASRPSRLSSGKSGATELDKEGGITYWPLRGMTLPATDADMDRPSTEPKSSLQLDYVYGFRCHDTKSCLFYTASGEIAYFAAATGVIYNKETGTQRFFMGHDDDIKSMAIHPNGNILATGQVGKDPYICVWDANSMEQLTVLRGFHERGVSCLGFSQDGTKLLSIGEDNSHSIAIYDWHKGRILANDKGHTDKILMAAFNPVDNSIAVCGVKLMKFFFLDHDNKLTNKRGVFGKVGKVQTVLSLSFTEDGNTITGTADGEVYIWKGNDCIAKVENAHSNGVYAVFANEGEVFTGGKNGVLKVWDAANMKEPKRTFEVSGSSTIRTIHAAGGKALVGTSQNEIFEVDLQTGEAQMFMSSHFNELWGLAMHPEGTLFATACMDKTVRVFNIQTKEQMHIKTLKQEGHSCAYSPEGSLIAVGLGNGGFTVLDANTLEEVSSRRDRKEEIKEIKFSPDGRLLAVGSHDNFVDIYDVTNEFKKIATCKGHSSYITHLDWSADSRTIQSNCGAYEILFWDAETGKQERAAAQRDQQWSSWTCVLGWPVRGIWPEGSDGTDVNACARSTSDDLLVTADDFGMVKLFNYPVVEPRAKNKAYGGHSSHVTNIRWTKDDSHVISIGGKDESIFQWRVV